MAIVCRRQDGAVGVRQLQALGFSPEEIARLVAGGAFIRRHRGVLLDAQRRPRDAASFSRRSWPSFPPGF